MPQCEPTGLGQLVVSNSAGSQVLEAMLFLPLTWEGDGRGRPRLQARLVLKVRGAHLARSIWEAHGTPVL